MLAGPMLLLCAVLTSIVMLYPLQYESRGFDWSSGLMFGAIVSATDPVAGKKIKLNSYLVVAMLKELGASKKLGTIIEGESLLNDGTAMVLYHVVFVIYFVF